MSDLVPLTTIRERNKLKRLIGWVLLYILLISIFAIAVVLQTRRVNTLNFASGELQLTTPKTQYTVGDNISYTLRNNLSLPITFVNACPQEPLYVYSWVNNSWVRIHDTAAASACHNTPRNTVIRPGSSYTQSFADWPNLFNKPGIYRIVGLATNYTAIPYTDFQVIAKPVPPQVQTRTQIIIQKVITPIYIPVPSSSGGGGGDSGGGGGKDN